MKDQTKVAETWIEYAIEWDDGPLVEPSYTYAGRSLERVKRWLWNYGQLPGSENRGKIVERTVIRTEWRDWSGGTPTT